MSIESIAYILGKRQRFSLSLFDKQLQARKDPARKKAYLTSRRAGKTTCVLTDFTEQAISKANTHYAYIALTQPSAEGIAWPILQEIDQRFRLNASFQESKLRVKYPNGSTIKLYGADRSRWSSRLLGLKLAGCAIDEAGFYSINLYDLINEVVDPTLNDLQGQLILMSTPGIVPYGFFYDITAKNAPGWAVHRWNVLDNPHMYEQTIAKIAALKLENPNIEDTPFFKRNYLGQWVTDFGDRVYRYSFTNDLNKATEYKRQEGDRYLLGLDVGWYDSTAFSVIAWNPNRPHIYEVESFREKEMPLDKIASYCRMYCDTYPSLTIVCDPNHIQAVMELRRRYQLPIIEAHKSGKQDWIEVINSDFDSGTIKIVKPESSLHVEEMADLVWSKKANGELQEAPGLENGICDAFLYAFREAYFTRNPKPDRVPDRGTKESFELSEQKLIRRLEEEILKVHDYFE